ncbi:MAG: hypothetical protein ACOC2F_07555 [Bacteroidota bacterium]
MSILLKFYILIGILLSSNLYIYAVADGIPAGSQVLSQIEELRLNISKSDARKIAKISDQIDMAHALMQKARQQSNLAEANQMIEKAQVIFNEAIHLADEIFSKYIDDFFADLDAVYRDDLARAKHFEYKSEDYLEKGEHYRDTANTSKDFITAHNSLSQAFEFEAQAIVNQARALRIYQDFPVEYPYVWDDYIKPRLVLEKTARAFEKDTIDQEVVVDIPQEIEDTVYFRVQIAAHTIPINNKELFEIYQGNMNVRLVKEDGWYKYQIGNYLDYNLARELLNSCNVKKAFIVAYNSKGEKLVLTEVTHQADSVNQI